ncbi:MAG: hypothetical protein WBA93_32205 [Microcoleaceae cyanobacterium]
MGFDSTVITKKEENLSNDRGLKGKYSMVSSTNLRMVVIGAICPAYLPPYSTVFWHYKQWRSQGVIENIRDVLHSGSTPTGKKKIKWTTLIIIDSQAVKNTCNASVKSIMILFLSGN